MYMLGQRRWTAGNRNIPRTVSCYLYAGLNLNVSSRGQNFSSTSGEFTGADRRETSTDHVDSRISLGGHQRTQKHRQQEHINIHLLLVFMHLFVCLFYTSQHSCGQSHNSMQCIHSYIKITKLTFSSLKSANIDHSYYIC